MIKTEKVIQKVAVYGDASASSKDKHFIDAYNTASALAREGYVVVNGGGPGVMLAATMGAKNSAGRVEVVVIDPKKEPGNYEGSSQKNLNLADEVTVCDNYEDREKRIVDIADAYIIFKGGTGTLAEVGITWSLAKFDYGRHEPLIFFGREWEKIVRALEDGLNLEAKEKRVVAVAENDGEVISLLKKYGRKAENRNWWQKMYDFILQG